MLREWRSIRRSSASRTPCRDRSRRASRAPRGIRGLARTTFAASNSDCMTGGSTPLPLDDRDDASRREIGDDFEHTRRRHDDQPRLTWQRRARPPRDDVGLGRLVEQDRRELRACEASIRPRDLGRRADLIRRQRIEWVSSGASWQKDHSKDESNRRRPSNASHCRPHLRPGAGADVGDGPLGRAPRDGVPQKIKPPRLVPAMMSIAPSLLRSAT